jgi:hypothetical protein
MKPSIQIPVMFLTFLALGLPVSKAQTSSPPLTRQAPLWSATPKQVGYDSSVFRNFSAMVGGDEAKVQFLDDQRLALSWLTPDETGTHVIDPAKILSHLHLSIVDARNGQQLSSHEWLCTAQGVNLAYTASGQWLLSIGESVTLYSASFDKLRDLQNVGTQRSHTFVSPSGRTFLSYVTYPHDARSAELRDSGTFAVIDSWNDSRLDKAARILYSDVFALAQISHPGKPQQVYIREIGGSWNPYSPPIQGSQPTGFANDDTLVSQRHHELIAEIIGGAQLFSSTPPDIRLLLSSWSTAATSTGGERFAVILDRMRGLREEGLDMYPFPSDDRVIVYSIPQRSAIFSVKVKGGSPWPHWSSDPVWNRIALSPSGLLLAISSNEGVRVYALPPDEQTNH